MDKLSALKTILKTNVVAVFLLMCLDMLLGAATDLTVNQRSEIWAPILICMIMFSSMLAAYIIFKKNHEKS